MKSTDMAKIEALFSAYNDELSRQYEEVLLSFPRFAATDEEQAKIYSFVQTRMKDWQMKPFSYGDASLTPEEIISAITEPQSAFSVMLSAAQICDDGIPPFVITELGRFKEDLQNLAIKFILHTNWNEIDGDADYEQTSLPCSIFLNLLTKWDYHAEDIRLLEKLNDTEKPVELITDALRKHLISGGQAVLNNVIDMIETFCHQKFIRSAKRDVLILLLVEIARNSDDTAAYNCLRTCFINIREKVFAAICLSDLGDSRGADFLTEWLMNNYTRTEREIATQVINSIEHLGGDPSELIKVLALDKGPVTGH